MNKLGKSDKNFTPTPKQMEELQLIEEYKDDFSKILKGAKNTVLRNKGAIGQVAFDSIFGILNEVPVLNEVTALIDTFEHLGLDATRFNIDPGLKDGGFDLAKNIMSALRNEANNEGNNESNITDKIKKDLKAHHEQIGHEMTDEEIVRKIDKLKELIQSIKQKQQAAAPAAPKAAAGGNKKKLKNSRKHKKRNSKNTRKRKYKPKKKKTKRIIKKAKKSRKRKH
jgi:colicin import membrane protein